MSNDKMVTVIEHCAGCGRVHTRKDRRGTPCPRCGLYRVVARNYRLEQPMADALAAAADWDPNRDSDGCYN